ncbi:TPA: hypothetical protein OUL15_000716 [Clostridioides difficile]|nr:hypothetical protein [Clostridioides difficile]MCR8815210.1 hypothetical protein [Clostridioides difficile]MDU8789386.1 hypothetical protein [Clostridioides difficile]HBE8730971.1 hypothetical protein [Clostridioides difficile]HBE9468377.1 hypothetical protein [Clostridioides difficile]
MTTKLTDNASLGELMTALQSVQTDFQTGKNNLSSALGNPFVGTDKLETTKTKIETLKNSLAVNLTNKNVSANETESIQSLINKVGNIKISNYAAGTTSVVKNTSLYAKTFYLNSTSNPSYWISITNLNFLPNVFIAECEYTTSDKWNKYYVIATSYFPSSTVILTDFVLNVSFNCEFSASTLNSGASKLYENNKRDVYITGGSIRVPAFTESSSTLSSYKWYALKIQ